MSDSDGDDRICARLDEMNSYLFNILEILQELTKPQVVVPSPLCEHDWFKPKGGEEFPVVVCRKCGSGAKVTQDDSHKGDK